MPTFAISNPSDYGYLSVGCETNGVASGSFPTLAANLYGFPVTKPVSFPESQNVIAPNELRNSLAQVFEKQQGLDTVDFSFSKSWYHEMDPLFFSGLLLEAPSSSGGSASSYMSATSFASVTSFTPTSQPAHAVRISVTIVTTSAPMGAGSTIKVTGTDANGVALSEIMSTVGQGTSATVSYITTLYFLTVTNLTVTATVAGATIAEGSLTPRTRVYTPGGFPTLDSFSFQHYDGGFGRQYTGSFFSDASLSFRPDGDVKFTARGYTRNVTDISPSFIVPKIDLPSAGWSTNVYLDGPGVAGVTSYLDVQDATITFNTGCNRLHTLANTRYYPKTTRRKRSTMLQMTIDFASKAEWQQFRSSNERVLQFDLLGGYINDTVQRKLSVVLPVYYNVLTIDDSGDNVTATISAVGFYDNNLGYDISVTSINTQPDTVYAPS